MLCLSVFELYSRWVPLTYGNGTKNTCKLGTTVNFFSAVAGNITVKKKSKSNLENYNLILCFATSVFY